MKPVVGWSASKGSQSPVGSASALAGAKWRGCAGSPGGAGVMSRGAVLMMLVGEEEAAAILQKLEPEEVRQLGKAMFAGADVGEAEVEFVLDDFVDRARERTAIGFDPKPIIEGVMTRALGQEKADSVLARITPPAAVCQIDLLDWMDAGEIAAMIEKE